jgi:hypothetical protein
MLRSATWTFKIVSGPPAVASRWLEDDRSFRFEKQRIVLIA